MVAEAAHSWADTGNQGFLLIANRRGVRKPDEHRPLGYGREAYVWSLLAAVGLFVVGAVVSMWHGVSELMHPTGGHEDYLVGYIVLGVAFLLEGSSLFQAFRQLHGEAEEYDREVLEYAMATSDPTVRAGVRRGQRSHDRARDRLCRDWDCTSSPVPLSGMRSDRFLSAFCSAWWRSS